MIVFEDLHAFLWQNPTANNCNAYLIAGAKNILVDPGHDHLLGHVRDGLSRVPLSPVDVDLVIITHGHPDHLEGVRSFSEASASVAIHHAELDFLKGIAPQYGPEDFQPDILLREGSLKVGGSDFQIFHTPGHSPGSICLYWPARKALFTGDLVFSQGIGRTDLPGGNGKDLKESIQRISNLEVEYLLPGHGGIVTGKEKVSENFDHIKRYWFSYL